MRIYRFIPAIGYLIDTILKDSMIKNPYYKLYHAITSVFTLLATIIYIYNNLNLKIY
jgi:hypothetical protein